jgi:hypothetical protein
VIAGARLVGLIVLAVLAAACGSQAGAGAPASVISGTVAAGPILPVTQPGVPNTRPVPGATVEAVRGTEVVAVTRTDGDGRYRLTLQPGAYLIVAKSGRYLSRQQSHPATIAAGKTLTVNFVLDTGIR